MDFNALAQKAETFLANQKATQTASEPAGETSQETPPPVERPAVTHKQPILTGGADGQAVQDLVKLLEVCGHATNTIAKGENPDGILDASVMADVRAFCEEHGVQEDRTLYNERVPVADLLGKWVGPNTWQALYDEASRIIEGR
jgi:hypothetical protein